MGTPEDLLAAEDGCYEAARAAALSGVPLSTVYDWARSELVVPSVSPAREMLWSYADLMTLRLVAWLRRPKRPGETERVRASPMRQVRLALQVMAERGVDPWADAGSPSIVVDGGGQILIQDDDTFVDLTRQATLPHVADALNLLRPFSLVARPGGPDLVRPRPSLRIVPAKVAGEPHVDGTRITSRSLSALVRRGIPPSTIGEWYEVPEAAVVDAADLERQLSVMAVAA